MISVRHYKLGLDAFQFDAVEFCKTLLSREGMKLVRQSYSGKGNQDFCLCAIHAGDWVSALGSLWTMPLKERVVFLTNQVQKGHPLICFEYGVAKFAEASTIATLVNVTLPFLRVANERAKWDCACFNEVSLSNAPDELNSIYTQVLQQLSLKKCRMSIQDLLNFANIKLLNPLNPASPERTISSIFTTIMASQSPEYLPTPVWVYPHSQSYKSGVYAVSNENWTIIRKAKYAALMDAIRTHK